MVRSACVVRSVLCGPIVVSLFFIISRKKSETSLTKKTKQSFFNSIASMPIFKIFNFDDIRFVSYYMREERLKELTKDYLDSLAYWAEEIEIHKFGNKGLEYLAGLVM